MKKMNLSKLVRSSIVLCLCLLFVIVPLTGSGQKFSVSTNLLEYINFGTINGEFGLSITSKWSVYLQGKYNPFTFSNGGMQNRQSSLGVGGKYWLWHVNSGWFISSQLSYIKYNTGGILNRDTYEGDAYGITVGAGYSLMLNKHLNIDFGLGIMGGFTSYIKYLCPKCGRMVGEGKKVFIAPNNLLVQLSYLF